MHLTDSDSIFWITKAIACAVLLQGLELLQIRRAFASDGVWKWETLRPEFEIFPGFARWLLRAALDYPRFLGVIAAQIALAAAALAFEQPHPAVLIGMLAATGLTALRWRGTFNGGADYMTVLVLLLLSIEAVNRDRPAVRLGCLWYLSVQAVLSYFIAGVVKFRNADWRSGRVLRRFMSGPPYDPPDFFAALSKRAGLMQLSSWGILLFELSFPLVLHSPAACLAFLTVALVFHLLNFAIFGLNRFIFAWAAAYPALYFYSAQIIFK